MSNQNKNLPAVNNNGTNNGGKPADPPKEEKQPKKSLRQRAHEVKEKILAHKSARVGLRIVKGLGAAGIGLGGYILGRKSVKPTVVMVEPIKPEETEPEAPAEEPAETDEQED